ncbi:replication initiation factor domain-containing protein [Variovorax sp. EBFNA2]|uniref:replication initiation factor domain-containing protein n=1 Tax=Variovorax sp. EBFNA2 TaxID=3342097 RepID=UPI0029C0B215|nr:replication initiation factor domain-containing protein [Variovorax boronicumulans]WPG40569.1 replication initiation factor domain-containing protein [Variovorax boronicumulans]
MTRAARNALVLDGSEVKVRLQAARTASRSKVHIDWLRFTVQRRYAAVPSAALLFGPEPFNIWEAAEYRVHKVLADLPNEDHWAGAQAMQLAQDVAAALGSDFAVCPELRKGHDFYRHRWSIERNGQECGWVGFLASSESPRQQAQAKTIHCNLYGAACTFAAHGWHDRVSKLVEDEKAEITRVDLALDFFDGMPGGMDRLKDDYLSGAMDVYGKRPKTHQHGDWINNRERSFYTGSKQAGKETNVYEKGHQLFGPESGNPWIRIEIRYGNKLRELPVDVLRRAADFFAGSSSWHAQMLALADQHAEPIPMKTRPRLAIETVAAEVSRNLRWAFNTAAPTIAAAWEYLGDEFLELVGGTNRPGRLRSFNATELRQAFSTQVQTFSSLAGAGPAMQSA